VVFHETWSLQILELPKMSEEMSTSKIILFILYAVAMAMGVAVIVLPLLGQPVDFTMVGIALFCLALAGLNSATD
jgi:cation transporter-like permease